MALRELFATFGFDWDQGALDRLDAKVDSVFAKVERLAASFDRAAAEARQGGAAMATAAAGADRAGAAYQRLQAAAKQGGGAGAGARKAAAGLETWSRQAKAAGVDASRLGGIMGQVRARVRQAASGDRELSAAFTALGVDVGKVAASGRNSLSVWREITGRLSRVEDQAKRSRLALTLLGDEGARVARTTISAPPREARIARRTATRVTREVTEQRQSRILKAVVSGSPAMRDWIRQAQQAGVAGSTLRGVLGGLTDRVKAAAAGDRELSAAFRRLGVDVDRVSKSGRTSLSVWQEMVGRLGKVESEAERAKIALQLLGREGARIEAQRLGKGIGQVRVERAMSRPGRTVAPMPPSRARRAWIMFQRVVAHTAPTLARVTGYAHRADRELHALGRGGHAAARGLADTGRAARRVRSGASGSIMGGMLAANFWTMLASGIARAGTALIRFTAQGVVGFGKLIAESAVWADSLEKSLGMISGRGIFAGLAEFREASQTAGALALDVRTATDAYKKLRGVGFDRDRALDLVKLSADMKAGLGLTDEVVGRVQLAISQIKGAGKLQGDELRQLQETGLNVDLIWKSISEQMGVTVQEAMKLKEQGKVSADVALTAIESAVLTTLGTSAPGEAAGKLASTTLRGVMGQAKAAGQLWIIELGKAITPGLDDLAQQMGGSFRTLQDKGTIARFTDSVRRFFVDLVAIVNIHWPRIEKLLDGLIDVSAEGIDSATMSLDGFVDALLTAAEWVQRNWPLIKGYIQAGIEINWRPIMSALMSLIRAFAWIVDKIREVTTALSGLQAFLLQDFSAGSLLGVFSQIAGAATAAMGPVNGLIGLVKTSLQLLGALKAEQTPDKAGKAVGAGKSAVDRAVARLEAKVAEERRGELINAMGALDAKAAKLEKVAARGKNPKAAAATAALERVQVSRAQLAESARSRVPSARSAEKARIINLTDQRRLTVDVTGTATPARTGQAVQQVVQRQADADTAGILAAIAGATSG